MRAPWDTQTIIIKGFIVTFCAALIVFIALVVAGWWSVHFGIPAPFKNLEIWNDLDKRHN